MYVNWPIDENLRIARNRGRPRAEPRERVVLANIVAAQESDFRIEVVADGQALQLQAVAIAGVVELRPVAEVVAVEIRRCVDFAK